MASSFTRPIRLPTLVPLGDSALLVRFGDALDETSNRAAIGLADVLRHDPVMGVAEVVPNLVSVLLRYDPRTTDLATLAGEVRLRLVRLGADETAPPRAWTIPVCFDGPDLHEVASALELSVAAFVTAHNAAALRVLLTGFAPGFVYCGLHADALHLPRRATIRPQVPTGSILFAAGQTAITATEMPTGWHMLGHTTFRNFDAASEPPVEMRAGDTVRFTVAP